MLVTVNSVADIIAFMMWTYY